MSATAGTYDKIADGLKVLSDSKIVKNGLSFVQFAGSCFSVVGFLYGLYQQGETDKKFAQINQKLDEIRNLAAEILQLVKNFPRLLDSKLDHNARQRILYEHIQTPRDRINDILAPYVKRGTLTPQDISATDKARLVEKADEIISGGYALFRWGKSDHEGMVYANNGMVYAYLSYLFASKLCNQDPEEQANVRKTLVGNIRQNRDTATTTLKAVEGDKSNEITTLDNTPRLLSLGNNNGFGLNRDIKGNLILPPPPKQYYFVKLGGTALNTSFALAKFMTVKPESMTEELHRAPQAHLVIPTIGINTDGSEDTSRRMAALFVEQVNGRAKAIHDRYMPPISDLKAMIVTSDAFIETISITT